jgi:malate dehydrogenase (oxaloacetate-decarboxylating)
MPLSNPTEQTEAHPADLIEWSQNNMLIATGSPFSDINYRGKSIPIAQCNNAFIFPGIGLGVISAKPRLFTDEMLWAASETLSNHAPILKNKDLPLLPRLSQTREIVQQIGIAVAQKAIEQGLAQIDVNNDEDIILSVKKS